VYRAAAKSWYSRVRPVAITAAFGLLSVTPLSAAIAYVQGNYATPQSVLTTVTVTFTKAQKLGDLNVIAVGWNDSAVTVASVTDSSGNVYTVAVGPTVISGLESQSIYYAQNIAAASANANTVTVTFAAAAAYPDIRIAEYSGLNTVNPLNVTAASTGNSSTSSSGAVTTTYANDLLVGANLVQTATTGAGSGFTKRLLTSPDADILEDRTVTATGSYSATAPLKPAGQWIMQMVAFRAASSGGTPPTAPGNLTATAVSTSQINLSWTASTSSIGLANYIIQRCQGAGCSNFAQVASIPATSTSYSNTGLTAGTSYTYRVQASDTAGNLSAFSNTASATTQSPPTAPANLTATAVSVSQINLSWTASSSSFGLANYIVQRCQGTGCSNFAQIASFPATTTTYSDTGLTSGTAYSYRVQASDTAGNLSGFSNTATATTQGPPSAPGNLTATAVSTSQVNLSWTASSSSIGLANYFVQRCQGTGCSNFAQIASIPATTTTYSDTSLTSGTAYSYRVQASDTAGNLSAFSNVASATTQTPPTAPGNLTATATGATQINLSWTASSSTVGVKNYIVQRCQGTGCTNFVQVATPSGTTFSDTGLTASTSYSYQVQAVDTSGNLSPFSNVASTTTQAATPPTAPSNLTATAASTSQINLSWTASTSSVGVKNYIVQRCQGTGCTSFTQIGTPTGTTFSDTGLTASTSYSYQVQAVDTLGNLSGFSNVATATTLATAPTITYVQSNYATPQTSQTTVTVTFNAAQAAGDLNVIAVGWNDSTALVTAVTDKSGNTYTPAVGPTVVSGFASQSIYYAKNILAASAGANAVTVTFSTAALAADIRVLEYKGADPANPVDVTAAASGNSSSTSSGSATTTNAIDLLFGANLVQTTTTGPGSGFTSRMITSPDADIAEDRLVTATGSYSATAPVSPSGAWIMQMVAFRAYAGPPPPPPAAPGNLTAAPVSAAQISLSWTASTSSIGIANYLVQRCQGASCTAFAQVASVPGTVTAYTDSGLAAGTTYSYQVQAADTAGNLSPFSNVASATTQPVQPPTAPGSLTAAATGATQIGLSWTASTSNVGLASYTVQRCQGSGCTSFAQIATVPAGTTTYNDTGLTPSSSYSYRAQALDTLGNVSPFSNVAGATTQAAQPPTAPGNLTAVGAGSTQINLAWTASTSNVGVANYLVQRCQGTGCTSFAQIASVPGSSTTFNDTGVTTGNTYSYQVQAVDTLNNLSPFSNIATATPVSGLLGAYAFNEGSGSTTADSSSNNITGTIFGAAWNTGGKYGDALSFNGSSSYVDLGDPTLLQMTGSMTLEAWIYQTASTLADQEIIAKSSSSSPNLGWQLKTTQDTGVLTIAIAISPDGATHVHRYGKTILRLNTWYHVAGVYNAAAQTLDVYLNGVLDDGILSGTVPAAQVDASLNANIGRKSTTYYFNGIIDEARIYDRALAQPEVQNDMNTPLGPSNLLPGLNLNITSLNFGNQVTGTQSSPQVITLTNNGATPTSIAGIALSSSGGLDFTQSTTCGSSLAIGGNCSVSAVFSPSESGTLNATLTIFDNAPGNPHLISVTGAGIGSGFSVTPRTATLTPNLTQQFSSTSGGVTWSVDGVVNGSSSSGTITAGGLYTPAQTAGIHTVTATSGSQSSSATVYVTTYAGMFTYHSDNFRSGQNLNETVLTPTNVNANQFGKLFSYTVDGEVLASPLYVPNVNISGQGTHNVVFVATEHDSVFAFDADGLVSAPLWQVSFINPPAGITTEPAGDSEPNPPVDIIPEHGITGTPVIDQTTGTLFVVAKTKEVSGTTTNYVYRLHALDITSGAERPNSPQVIQASGFTPLAENQRPGLLLSLGVVYVGFGSHGDNLPWHGWMFGYNETTLQQVYVYNTTPNGSGGGIWQAGGAPAADTSGNLFFATGNGTFDANTGGSDFGDSVLKLSSSEALLDYFTPYDQANMLTNDLDLGSAGPVLLVDQTTGPYPHLLVTAGKTGTIYVVNRDNMGHYNKSGNTQIVQSLSNALATGSPGYDHGNYVASVFFNNLIYYCAVTDYIRVFQLTNGLLSTPPVSMSAATFGYPGASLGVSANGTSNAVLWAVERIGTDGNGVGPTLNGVLHAYNAGNLTTELYNSNQAAGSRDALSPAAKFNPPLVANGRIYIGSEDGHLTVYGLLP
jgi:fibronectin type 3 domain-containing protein